MTEIPQSSSTDSTAQAADLSAGAADHLVSDDGTCTLRVTNDGRIHVFKNGNLYRNI